MAEELVDALFGNGEAQPPQPEPGPAPQPEPATEPQPAEPKPEPQPEPQPAKAEPTEHSVPLAKYLDTRDELKALRAWKAEQEAKQQAPAKAPDPVDDPDGHTAYLRAEMQRELTAQKFENSDVIARQSHGDEKVETALNWAAQRAEKDPIFAAQYMRERHPIDWIVRQHQRDGIVSQLPNDISSLDELIEREIAKRGLSAPTAPASAVAPAAQAPVPPKSIASESASPGQVSDPKAEFEAIFAKR